MQVGGLTGSALVGVRDAATAIGASVTSLRGELRGRTSGPNLDAIGKLLGMSTASLKSALQGGKSLATVAHEHGKSTAEVEGVVVDRLKSTLDGAVKAGKLSQGQADAILQGLRGQVDGLVTGLPQHLRTSARASTSLSLLDAMQANGGSDAPTTGMSLLDAMQSNKASKTGTGGFNLLDAMQANKSSGATYGKNGLTDYPSLADFLA